MSALIEGAVGQVCQPECAAVMMLTFLSVNRVQTLITVPECDSKVKCRVALPVSVCVCVIQQDP